MNIETFIYYLVDCKICTFAENILKYAFYT